METQTLEALAEAVAEALGDGWTASAPPMEYRGVDWQEINHEDGRTIVLDARIGRAPQGKLKVRGRMPSAPTPGMHHRTPSIGVSRNRDPEAIARDIERRLLPEYAEALDQAEKANAQERARRRAVVLTARKLADELGIDRAEIRDPGSYRTLTDEDANAAVMTLHGEGYGIRAEVRIEGSARIRMEIRADGIDVARAAVILRGIGYATG